MLRLDIHLLSNRESPYPLTHHCFRFPTICRINKDSLIVKPDLFRIVLISTPMSIYFHSRRHLASSLDGKYNAQSFLKSHICFCVNYMLEYPKFKFKLL